MFHEYLNGIKNIKQNCRNIALLRICALLNCPFVKCWSMLPALARLTAAIGSMKCIAQCRASTCTATPFSGRHLSALRMLAQLDALIRNCPSLARLLARRRWRAAAHKRLLPFHARLYPLLQTLETLWT